MLLKKLYEKLLRKMSLMINYLCYYYNIPYLLIILTINYH